MNKTVLSHIEKLDLMDELFCICRSLPGLWKILPFLYNSINSRVVLIMFS